MRTCIKVLRELEEAARRWNLGAVKELVREAARRCGPGELREALAARVAPALAEAALRVAVELYRRLEPAVGRGRALEAALEEASGKLARLESPCWLAEAAARAVPQALARLGWEGPRWPFAARLLVTLHLDCGGVPDGVLEAFGPEEAAAILSFLEEGAAVLDAGPAPVALYSSRLLLRGGRRSRP
ncbi:MAG: hypothetical protein LM577_06280 [Thermoproteaceae archaeon]|nr:hypothetical protein [Thermoproteaceae archaeon]